MSSFDLERFVESQRGVYEQVRAELAAGRKQTHWIWFIFPQIQGLGSSSTSRKYAISGLDEARAYLAHPVLGARLAECTGLVNAHAGGDLGVILGYPDDLKFHSSMTLFARAAGGEDSVFSQALLQWFDGREDQGTVERI